MCTDGVIVLELFKGTLDGDKFITYLRGTLIPEMMPFDGINPRSVLIMDNCSVHCNVGGNPL